ncbi:hypothetical protein H4R19_006048, partial [Coemansia spiralis]
MLSVEEQVRQIMHPSSHAQIQQIRETVRARGTNERQGAANKLEWLEKHAKLDSLYDRVQKAGKLKRADYAALLEGYSEIRDSWGCVRVLRHMCGHGETPGSAQFAMVLKTAADERRAPAVFEVGEQMQLAGVEDRGGNYATFFNSLLACLGECGQIEH